MGGEGCRVRRREEEGVITHLTRWGGDQERMRSRGGRVLETREASEGNRKTQYTVCGVQFMHTHTHFYSDMNSDTQMLILDM